MPIPHNVVWGTMLLGVIAACMVPLGRMYPDIIGGKVAEQIAIYDQKVIAFAHKTERLMLCAPGGKLGKATKTTEEAFNEGDLDKNGSLSSDELSPALKKLGVEKITLEQCQGMIQGADADADGVLSKEEFHCAAGHASALYAKVLRSLGASFLVLGLVAFPPCGYYGFDLMHDEFGNGKNYKWMLVPLGLFGVGIAYASTEGMVAVLPFITMYAGASIFVLVRLQ